MLAIIKIGAAYVYIPENSPDGYIESLFDDIKPPCTITLKESSSFSYEIDTISLKECVEYIDNLDNSIESMSKVVDFLGTTVEWGNKVCLGTEGVLTV